MSVRFREKLGFDINGIQLVISRSFFFFACLCIQDSCSTSIIFLIN